MKYIKEIGTFYYKNKRGLLYLFIFILSLGIRLWGLDSESAWIDEAYSIHLSQVSIQDIFSGCINDQHPPLYYIILKIWLGNSIDVFKARLLSVLIGSINIVQVMFILQGSKIFNMKTTLITGLLVSVSPMHIWYSQEARMYILLLFFILLSIQTFVQLLRFIEKDIQRPQNFLWFLFVIFNILSLYTHYFSVFIILFELIFFIFYVFYKKFTIKKTLFGIYSFFAIGLAFLPWVRVVLNQVLLHKLNWIDETTFYLIATSINRLIIGPGVIFLPKELSLFVFISFILFIIFGLRRCQKNFPGNHTFIILLILWIIIPTFLISFLSLFFPIFQFKQLIIILVPILATVVFFIMQVFKEKIAILITCCLIGVNFLSSIYQQISLTKDNWKGLTYFIEQNYNSGDVIYFNTSASQLGFTLYQQSHVQILGFPHEYDVIKGGWYKNEINLEDEIDNLKIVKNTYERIWYVQYYPDLWDPEKLIYSWLNNNMIVQFKENFGSILLVLYD